MRKIAELKPRKTIAVCDYMMKLLLQKFREPQRDQYAKKGVSIHGSIFFYKSSDSSEIEVEIHDVFSNGDCVQNCFFTASAFAATLTNFPSKHDDITSLVIWSDSGPHYHNTSIILWLMRFSKLFPIKIERYSFFEAQKGKMSLDSHFATFKFVLKGWMKKGNDILESEDIVNGTKDDLKGTQVYKIHIDRLKEPASAKTWNGITLFGDFTFIYDHSECSAIEAREQTSKCKPDLFTKEKLVKLWPSYLTSDTISTEVISDYDGNEHDNIQPRFIKKPKEEKIKSTDMAANQPDGNTDLNVCKNCGKAFLRIGCLHKHVDSNLCINKAKERTKSTVSKTVTELRESILVSEALGIAAKMRKLEAPASNMLTNTNTIAQSLFSKMLKGSAQKKCSKVSKKFTTQQKEIMDLCFDEGEYDKKKRCTVSKCRKILERKLGEKMVLSETQIASYWSAYKRKMKLQKK